MGLNYSGLAENAHGQHSLLNVMGGFSERCDG